MWRHLQVHVTVGIDGYPEIPPLAECEAAGANHVSCHSGLPDEATYLTFPDQLSGAFVRLRCTVEGAGTGDYHCQAGKEPGGALTDSHRAITIRTDRPSGDFSA